MGRGDKWYALSPHRHLQRKHLLSWIIFMSCDNLPLDFCPKQTPYYIPPSVLTVSPFAMRIRKQNNFQAPVYVRESFEVVVPSSPLTDIANTANSAEEVPPAQVDRSVNELSVTMKLAESRITQVMAMREKQAKFVASRESLICQLDDESDRLDMEITKMQEKISAVESAIVNAKMDLGIIPSMFYSSARFFDLFFCQDGRVLMKAGSTPSASTFDPCAQRLISRLFSLSAFRSLFSISPT